MAQLRLSDSRTFANTFQGGVTCMDLDKVEDRFLLSGGADTTLALFDTHTGSEQVCGRTHIGKALGTGVGPDGKG